MTAGSQMLQTLSGPPDLTREMNAAPALFEKWQPDIPFMQAIKSAVVKAIEGPNRSGFTELHPNRLAQSELSCRCDVTQPR
jgi:hypothetical protein